MTLDRTFRWTPRCRRHGVSHLFSPGLALYLASSFCTLHRQVTDLLLFELFSQVGPVERVTIPLAENGGTEAWRETGSKCGDGAPAHRGYAFVQMADGPVT